VAHHVDLLPQGNEVGILFGGFLEQGRQRDRWALVMAVLLRMLRRAGSAELRAGH
jgi:hypothetical protein